MVWSMRMNYPLYSTALFSFLCQVPSLGLKYVLNSARCPHWNQRAAGGCSWEQNAVSGAGCPDHLHWHKEPPLLLFPFQIRPTTAAPFAPCVKVGVLLATASMQVVWPAGFRQPRPSRTHRQRRSPPHGQAPCAETQSFGLPSDPRLHRHLFQCQHQENTVRY